LWKAADKLRKNIDAAEYKHVVLGLIFLKYISDAFNELHEKLVKGEGEYAGADPEDRDEYKAENVFFVPPSVRWKYLQPRAKPPEIGKDVDEAMDAIEKDNPSLRGVLPKVYARKNLDPTSLGGLIDLISNIALGDAKARSADVLGHVFEYFLGEFALVLCLSLACAAPVPAQDRPVPEPRDEHCTVSLAHTYRGDAHGGRRCDGRWLPAQGGALRCPIHHPLGLALREAVPSGADWSLQDQQQGCLSGTKHKGERAGRATSSRSGALVPKAEKLCQAPAGRAARGWGGGLAHHLESAGLRLAPQRPD
jgi:hypothetical protein